MNGTRNDGVVNQTIDLYFQFTLNYRPYDAYSVHRVEIYPTMDDAIANTNKIRTIESGDITRVDTGLYKYNDSEALPQAYFDKVFLEPRNGDGEIYFINTFYVRPEEIGGGAGEQPKSVLVFGFADQNVNPVNQYPIRVRLDRTRIYDNKVSIIQKRMTIQTNLGGYWEIPLVVTDLMETGGYYIFNINGQEYKKTVPQSYGPSCNIFSLPDFT